MKTDKPLPSLSLIDSPTLAISLSNVVLDCTILHIADLFMAFQNNEAGGLKASAVHQLAPELIGNPASMANKKKRQAHKTNQKFMQKQLFGKTPQPPLQAILELCFGQPQQDKHAKNVYRLFTGLTSTSIGSRESLRPHLGQFPPLNWIISSGGLSSAPS
ncbi:MAG: hypothetical protein NWE93_07265 [Candidatus Bathyarchaeota archaeon]|nr:hypothetical protein [Candidatus Bathyarchaeota archaeon]